MTTTSQGKRQTLHSFIAEQRQELIALAREKVAKRASPRVTKDELTNGVPLFLTQLSDVLEHDSRQTAADGVAIRTSAQEHGVDMLRQGFTIEQVVQDYGTLCQSITQLAMEKRAPISTSDFQVLNKCLDNAIAGAVTEYSRQRDVHVSGAEIRRQGFFAHELRNHLNTALLAFQVVKSGRVGMTGSTAEVLEKSLRVLRELIDRSVLEVRLASGIHQRERLRLAEFIEEMEITASADAANRGIQFSFDHVDTKIVVDVDRHLFASAISNLLQNAFKFTRVAGHVWLRAVATPTHVSIEVEDECGGLPAGAAEIMFRPFEQRGADRAGLGLGLAISRRAIEADAGTISVRDLPGKGCVFVVTMPRASAEPITNGTPMVLTT